MSRRNIMQAWKDAEYRLCLSEAGWALLPARPEGFIDLTNLVSSLTGNYNKGV